MHTYSQLLYHVVFCVKRRAEVLDADLIRSLCASTGTILRTRGGRLLAMGGRPDHVHLLVALPPALAVADAVRLVKCNTSRWIRRTQCHLPDFTWQVGYGAFSVSAPHREAVARYIRAQEAHHAHGDVELEWAELVSLHDLRASSDGQSLGLPEAPEGGDTR